MPKITENQISDALNASRKSPMHKKFGAILINNGKIISVGYNYYKGSCTNNITQCLLCI